MTTVSEGEYCSLAEAASLFGVSRTTLWRWIADGRLSAYRIGPRTVRVRRDELLGLLRPAREAGNGPGGGAMQEAAGDGRGDAGIWENYSADKVRAALRGAAGAFAGADVRRLQKDVHAARKQAGSGRPA